MQVAPFKICSPPLLRALAFLLLPPAACRLPRFLSASAPSQYSSVALPVASSLDPPSPFRPFRDPDSVVLCLLAIDEEEEDDIALQIHFTLIQSFCCDNDIDIVRVSGMQRLAELLGEPAETQGATEARDLHCLLVTNPHTEAWKSHGLVEVASYCQESRGNNQWVPYISLQER
ncbi:growth arrest and DNA damage-inducible protein GADD45 beta isoform 2-T2 [Erethizon dorsatum]